MKKWEKNAFCGKRVNFDGKRKIDHLHSRRAKRYLNTWKIVSLNAMILHSSVVGCEFQVCPNIDFRVEN